MTSCVEFICYLLKYYEYNFECKILMAFDVKGKLHCMYIKLLVISIITNYLDVHWKMCMCTAYTGVLMLCVLLRVVI